MARQACPAVRGFDGGEEMVAVAPCGKMHHPVSAAHIQVRSTQCILVGWNEIDDGLAGALPMNTVFRIGFADMIIMPRTFGAPFPAKEVCEENPPPARHALNAQRAAADRLLVDQRKQWRPGGTLETLAA